MLVRIIVRVLWQDLAIFSRMRNQLCKIYALNLEGVGMAAATLMIDIRGETFTITFRKFFICH